MRWAVALCLLPGAAMATLPPQDQRRAELVAILQDDVVGESLRDEPVDLLLMIRADVYCVQSENCTATVGIVDTGTQTTPGPRQFAVVV